MESLVKTLKGADTFKKALGKLKGKDIVVEYHLGGYGYDAQTIEVLEAKTDYYIAMWKGKTSKKEFFSKYDANTYFTLKE